jgi:hypothetical protein
VFTLTAQAATNSFFPLLPSTCVCTPAAADNGIGIFLNDSGAETPGVLVRRMMTQNDSEQRARAIQYHSWSAVDDFLPREFLLAVACCRWPPSEARDTAIRAAATDVSDWNTFLRVVKRQRIVGLVHHALLSARIDVPSPIAKEITSGARLNAMRNLLMRAETVRLHRAFDEAHIPVLVLKGVALAQLAYGSLHSKHTRDIDLLVPPDRAEAALQLLEHENYALASPAQHLSEVQRRALVRYGREAEFAHRGNNLRVELQWRIADNPLLLRGVDAHSTTQNVCVFDRVSVPTLAEEHLFAALCVHGALHAWSRLKWLADLNALIGANDADIVRLYRNAQHVGAGLCAGQMLLLCHRLFDLRLPVALAEEIQASRRVKKLVAIALSAMIAPHAETEIGGGFLKVTRTVYRHFLLGQGWAFFVAQCRVVSVGRADVLRLPLPSSLHFLYPLLRLPLWLWRRTMSALSGRNQRVG